MGKSVRDITQALGMAYTITWNVLKKKETTVELTTRHQTGARKKQQQQQQPMAEIVTEKKIKSVTLATTSTVQG